MDIGTLRAGFIGAGKAGFSLGKYFAENGAEISGYISRNAESASEAASFTGSRSFEDISEIIRLSDIIFITVPDREIEGVWKKLIAEDISGRIICHCSGALSSSVFSGADETGTYVCSVHPLFAISDRYESFRDLHRAVFTIEGSPGRIEEVEGFIRKLGNRVQLIEPESKIRYHAAAVMASNHMVALAQLGIELLEKCGFSEADALMALGPLMAGNVESTIRNGPEGALTGPVERNDIITIQKHMESLSGTHLRVYRELSRVLLKIAEKKHPEEDYLKLEKELEENEKHRNDNP